MELSTPEDDPRSRRLWLTLLGVSLALALIGAAFVQLRQYTLLDDTANYQHDALGWSFFQLETEHLRLRNQIYLTVREPDAVEPDALQLRYDIFVSRLGLVDHDRAARLMQEQSAYEATIRRARAFVAHADRYLGANREAPLTTDVLRALLDELDSLGAPLHDLSLSASHLLYERVTERIGAVRTQSQMGIAFTLFQCVLLLVFAFVVLRQFRTLLQRRHRLETLAESLGAARIEAEAASRAKSAFLANMSHEIRTPFHGMLGMMSLLQETPLSAQQASYLHTAKESANHLLTILNDILDISKLESGNLQISLSTVDLARLVREVDALMRVQAQSKGLALHVSMDEDLPRWVHADATRLKQVLFNLLSNALKFTPAGHIHLKVELAAERASPRMIVFSVMDTGIGIDDAMRKRLFQRFVQGDETTSRRHGGTGLGLEISRSLARLMGGDIVVKSTLGAGSTFSVSLPLAPVQAPVSGTASSTPSSEALGRPLKVLVAEDHPVNQAYLEAVLDKLGHQAVFSENGEEAVRAAQAEDFDIVLMDLHMPVMDGFAAARAIRALPLPRGAMPIVALTADAFQDSQDRARDAGMDEMLTKPAHLPQLRELLGRYGGGHAPPPAPARQLVAEGASDIVDRATVAQFHASLSPQKYGALLASFFDAHADTMKHLRHTVATGDRPGTRDQAHALKGAALSLGLRAVVEHAEALREAACGPLPAHLPGLLDQLERQLMITRDLCRSLGWLPVTGPGAGHTVG